ncbi:YbhN family protein [Acidobacteriota bacterium]
MRKSVKNTILFLILISGLIYLYFNRSYLQAFSNLGLHEIIGLLFLSYAGFLFLGLGFKFILKIFSLDIPYREWFGLTICNTMFNYYVPARGGTVAKAYYLKKKYGFEYPHYVSLMAGSFIISLVLTSLLGLAAVLLTFIFTGRFILSLALVFSLFLVVSLFSGFITRVLSKLTVSTRFERLNLIMENIKDGLTYFSSHKKATLNFCIFSVLFILFMILRLYVCFIALDFNVSFMAIALIRLIAEFTFLISIVPGNLGIKEGIIVFSASIFEIPLDQAVTAAILDRAVSMFLIFALGFFYSRGLLGKLAVDEKGTGQESEIPVISENRKGSKY